MLAHLRACADARGEPIRAILAEDHPTFRAINPLTWIKRTSYLEMPFRRSLRAFTQQRTALLAVLRPLPRKDWARAATVTGAGKPIERTALLYATWVAFHERPHVKQIERIARAMRDLDLPEPPDMDQGGPGSRMASSAHRRGARLACVDARGARDRSL